MSIGKTIRALSVPLLVAIAGSPPCLHAGGDNLVTGRSHDIGVIAAVSPETAPSAIAAPICTPTVKWVWDGDVEDPNYPMACATPLVLQLTDDNGDGKIDGDDDPDVAFVHHTIRGVPQVPGVLAVLDGATGATHFNLAGPELMSSGLAAADIDGDGVVELVAMLEDQRHLIAFEHDGTPIWTSDAAPFDSEFDTVGFADLDQDGTTEIYVGPNVFEADGTLRFHGTGGTGGPPGPAHMSLAADVVPGSPGLELIGAYTAYDANGGVVWDNPVVPDGHVGIGDFDLDGEAEVVIAASVAFDRGEVHLLDGDGTSLGTPYTMTTTDPNASGSLSQPVVADFDGDGEPEVFIAQGDQVQALEWDGTDWVMMWRVDTVDFSRRAGGAAFDFDADGAWEIVYHDEVNWYIFDGRDGTKLFELPFPSLTLIETPVIADIDKDGRPEILIGGCGRQNEIVAYDCDVDVPTRALWNQFQYHVCNIEDDGTVPQLEEPSWTTHGPWIGQTAGCGCDDCATIPEVVAQLEPLPVEPPRSAASPASVCSAPRSRTFEVICGGSDECLDDVTLEAVLLATTHSTSGGSCTPVVEEIEVECGELVELALLPPACPDKPRSAGSATSVRSDGVPVVTAESVVLEVRATDGCGNVGTARYDPALEPSPLCEEVLEDGACCTAIGAAPGECKQPACGALRLHTD